MRCIFEGQPPKTGPFPIKGHLGSGWQYMSISLFSLYWNPPLKPKSDCFNDLVPQDVGQTCSSFGKTPSKQICLSRTSWPPPPTQKKKDGTQFHRHVIWKLGSKLKRDIFSKKRFPKPCGNHHYPRFLKAPKLRRYSPETPKNITSKLSQTFYLRRYSPGRSGLNQGPNF